MSVNQKMVYIIVINLSFDSDVQLTEALLPLIKVLKYLYTLEVNGNVNSYFCGILKMDKGWTNIKLKKTQPWSSVWILMNFLCISMLWPYLVMIVSIWIYPYRQIFFHIVVKASLHIQSVPAGTQKWQWFRGIFLVQSSFGSYHQEKCLSEPIKKVAISN